MINLGKVRTKIMYLIWNQKFLLHSQGEWVWLAPKKNDEFEVPYAGRVLRTHSGKTLVVDDDGQETWVEDSEVGQFLVNLWTMEDNQSKYFFSLYASIGYQTDSCNVTKNGGRYDNAGWPTGVCHSAQSDCALSPETNLRKLMDCDGFRVCFDSFYRSR